MFTTGCKIDGIDFRLDYEKISEDNSTEYSGILHVRDPIAFIFNEDSFSPSNTGQAHIDAIRKAITINEDHRSK
ncbi:MAG TPA: hypothetical protein VHZ50_06780 [Puia sp.]|jgi:hypothetical protein|nr:hypothetical protein [Puia sp.]